MRFEFATAGRILFGPGTAAEVPSLAAGLGRRACVITNSQARCAWLLQGLARQALSTALFLVEKEPDVAAILRPHPGL